MAKQPTYEQIQARLNDPHRCRHEVFTCRGGHHRCQTKGKFERDGAWFCWTHDPVGRKERDDVRMKEWLDEQARLRDAAGQRARDQRVGAKLRELDPARYDKLLAMIS